MLRESALNAKSGTFSKKGNNEIWFIINVVVHHKSFVMNWGGSRFKDKVELSVIEITN